MQQMGDKMKTTQEIKTNINTQLNKKVTNG